MLIVYTSPSCFRCKEAKQLAKEVSSKTTVVLRGTSKPEQAKAFRDTLISSHPNLLTFDPLGEWSFPVVVCDDPPAKIVMGERAMALLKSYV